MRGLVFTGIALLLLSASCAKPVLDRNVLEEERRYADGQQTSQLAYSNPGTPTRKQVDNFVMTGAAATTAVSEELFRNAEPIPYAGIAAPNQRGLALPQSDCIVACTSKCVPDCIRAEKAPQMCASECSKFCSRDCRESSHSAGAPVVRTVSGSPGGPPGTRSSLAGPAFQREVRGVAMQGAAVATAVGEETYRQAEPLTLDDIKAAKQAGHTLPLTQCITVCTRKCVGDCIRKEGAIDLCAKDCTHFCGEDCRTGFRVFDTSTMSHGEQAAMHQKVQRQRADAGARAGGRPGGAGRVGGGTSESEAFQYESASNAVFPWQSKKLDSKTLGPRECDDHCNFECLRECTEGYDKPHLCPDECRTNCRAYCGGGKDAKRYGGAARQSQYDTAGNGGGTARAGADAGGEDWEVRERRRQRRSAADVSGGTNSVVHWAVELLLVVAGCLCVYALVRRRIGDYGAAGAFYVPLRSSAAVQPNGGRKLTSVREEPEYSE